MRAPRSYTGECVKKFTAMWGRWRVLQRLLELCAIKGALSRHRAGEFTAAGVFGEQLNLTRVEAVAALVRHAVGANSSAGSTSAGRRNSGSARPAGCGVMPCTP